MDRQYDHSETSPAGEPPTEGRCEARRTEHSPVGAIQVQVLESSIVEVLRTVYDPEIPVNIYELGLIYDVEVDPGGEVNIRMTLTSPACPVAGSLVTEVERRVRDISGVTRATVEVVWDPPWSPDKMTEAARLQLNI